MSPDDARALFLPLHGLVGLCALVGGVGALATRPGSRPHIWLGRLFTLGMAGAILAATPVLLATQNVFLTGMGGFAAYMTVTGWRIARQRGAAGGRLDRGISTAMVVFGLSFAAWGLRALLRGGGALGIVPVLMGVGSVLFARSHLRWYAAPAEQRSPWQAEHLGAMGGGLIAALTAFGAATGTNLLPVVPEPIWWLGPTLILGPLLRRASSKVT